MKYKDIAEKYSRSASLVRYVNIKGVSIMHRKHRENTKKLVE